MDWREIFSFIFFLCISAGIFLQIILIIQIGKIITLLSRQTQNIFDLILNIESFKLYNEKKQEIALKKKSTDAQRWAASQKKKEWWAKKKASEGATSETPGM